jgi:hypothetical protein
MTLAQVIYRRISARRMAHSKTHDYGGGRPCIPPLALAGMVDRILLRARVQRDNEFDG